MSQEPWHTDLQWEAIKTYVDYTSVAIVYVFIIWSYQWFYQLYLLLCGGGMLINTLLTIINNLAFQSRQ